MLLVSSIRQHMLPLLIESVWWRWYQWAAVQHKLSGRTKIYLGTKPSLIYRVSNTQMIWMPNRKLILSYQGLRLSNLTLGLTALSFSDWILHKPKIATINMINRKAVQKSINTRPPDKMAWLIYIQFSYLTT